MELTLKKFKEQLKAFLQKPTPKPNLDFGCQNITIAGKNYLMCRAVVPDIQEILRIKRAIYHGEVPHNFSELEEQIKDKQHGLYIVVRYEDQMVAFAGCDMAYAKSEAHITKIAVLPKYQKQGLGSMMLQTLIKEAKAYGCKKISVDVKKNNLKVQKLYQEKGFRPVSRTKACPLADGVKLEYNILPIKLTKRVGRNGKKKKFDPSL